MDHHDLTALLLGALAVVPSILATLLRRQRPTPARKSTARKGKAAARKSPAR
jgi:hypothetical protein